MDLRLRAFESALSQVDAQLSERIGELRRRIDKRLEIEFSPSEIPDAANDIDGVVIVDFSSVVLTDANAGITI